MFPWTRTDQLGLSPSDQFPSRKSDHILSVGRAAVLMQRFKASWCLS